MEAIFYGGQTSSWSGCKKSEKMIKETWRSVEGWGMYHVSNMGRVRSHKFGTVRILKPSPGSGGYLQVAFTQLGRSKKFLVSRLVAKAFLPNPESKPQVNHKDFDISNNRATNLEWSTIQENLFHAVLHESRNKKLTHSQVAEILKLEGKFTQQKIADRYGVNRSMIGAILRREVRKVLNTE